MKNFNNDILKTYSIIKPEIEKRIAEFKKIREKEGKKWTDYVIILSVMSAFLVLISTFVFPYFFYILLFSLTAQICIFFHLARLKKEWYERFCK